MSKENQDPGTNENQSSKLKTAQSQEKSSQQNSSPKISNINNASDLFELLERCQSQRLDDQRCVLPSYFSQVSKHNFLSFCKIHSPLFFVCDWVFKDTWHIFFPYLILCDGLHECLDEENFLKIYLLFQTTWGCLEDLTIFWLFKHFFMFVRHTRT